MTLVAVSPDISDTMVRVAHIAQSLGRLRRNGMREDFETVLRNLGMQPDEALQYWEHVDIELSMKNNWNNAESNRELAVALGIFLNNTKYPRNWLLYRLLELSVPNVFRAKLLGFEHMGGARSRKNRWRPNEALKNRRIIQFDICPHNGKSQNPLPVYRLFAQAAAYV